MENIITVALLTILASIGPTQLLAIKEGIRKGRLSTFWIMMGGTLVDALYATLVGFGLTQLGDHLLFQLILLFVGMAFFSYLGIAGLLRLATHVQYDLSLKDYHARLHPLFLGIMMTLPNPYVIVFWATMSVSRHVVFSRVLPIVIIVTGFLLSLIEGMAVAWGRSYISNQCLRYLE